MLGIKRGCVVAGVAGLVVAWFTWAMSFAGVIRPGVDFVASSSIPADVQARAAVASYNMIELRNALYEYAYNNSDRLPSDLRLLYPQYVSDPKVFWHPGDPDARPTTIDNNTPNQPNSTRISFEFSSAAKISDLCDSDPIIWDNSAANNAGLFVSELTNNEGLKTTPPVFPTYSYARGLARYHMYLLADALIDFAINNGDLFPADLTQLTPQPISCPETFWNPGDSDPRPTQITNSIPNASNSSQISFAYLGGRYDYPSLRVVLLDNSLANNAGAGILVTTVSDRGRFFERSSRSLPITVTARANLRQIGAALLAYATDNNALFPPKLSMLYPNYISDPAVFWHPGDRDPVPTTINNDVPNSPNSAQISYRYLGADYSTNCNPGAIMAVDDSLSNNGGTGINILTADGNADYYAPPLPSCPFAGSCFWTATSNLRQLGFALYWYANEHAGILPANLSDLYQSGFLLDPMVFWNPGDSDPAPLTIDNDSPNQVNSSQISFEYRAAGRDLWDMELNEVLAQDNSANNNGGRGIAVLYADGHTEFISNVTLTGIAISSGPDAVPEAGFAQYTCTATYSDGSTMDVTSLSRWSLTSGPGAMGGNLYVAPVTVLADATATLHVSYEDYFDDWPRITKGADKTITVQKRTSIGDLDHDGDVDQADFGYFQACFTGPAIPYDPAHLPPGCTLTPDAAGIIPVDYDRDRDVDQSDFGLFQAEFTRSW